MADAEENYKQRLAELLGTPQDPFSKVASDDTQLDLVTQTLYDDLGEDLESGSEQEVPELLRPVPVQKVASIADFSERDIFESAPFQAGFRSVMVKRAHELEDALEKLAMEIRKGDGKNVAGKGGYVKKYLRGKAGEKVMHGVGIGTLGGAALGAYGTHKANQTKAPEDRQSVLGGAAKGGAIGGVAGGVVAHGDTLLKVRNTRLQRKAALDKAVNIPGMRSAKMKRRAQAEKAARLAKNDTWSFRAGKGIRDLRNAVSGKTVRDAYKDGVQRGS